MRRQVIQLSGIRKTYGKTVAVDEISFDVSDGEIFGLIGPNGAGKTTTMECVAAAGAAGGRAGAAAESLGVTSPRHMDG